MQKDEEERNLMRKASNINDMAMNKLQQALLEDLTEKEMASKLSKIYEYLGADGFSFPPIIAYGSNGTDPHASCGHSKLQPGDAVILDIGCVKDNYCSDMTRTVFFKEAPQKAKEVFEIVLEANKRAISLIKPGMRFCDIDNYCSDMTRTVFFKEAPQKAKEVFEIVLEANKRAISLIKPGMRFCDIDNAARSYITEK